MIECTMANEAPGFECTGSDESDSWKRIHAEPEKMHCGTCANHADYLFRGLHDHVNVGLGKGTYDTNTYEKFVNEVTNTHEWWISKGSPTQKILVA